MAVQHPERFGSAALRQRRNHWVRQAVLGFVLTNPSALLVPPSWTQAAVVVPTFFLMGSGTGTQPHSGNPRKGHAWEIASNWVRW
jgi:hypothetical protein